jgi:hypothetical protein
MRVWTLPSPSYELYGFVEALQKTRSVAVLEGRGPAHYRSEFSKMGHQRPACKGLANGILGERLAARTEHSRSLFKAARGQRNIPRDHDVVCRNVLNDPVIDSVELPFNNDEFAPVLVGNSNPRIGDHGDMESVSLCHAVNLLLHGARIGIDEYLKHRGPFLQALGLGLNRD